MILLIDGYNLLKNAYAQSHIKDSLRSEFINKLNQYSKKKNIKTVLVFDGGDSAYPTKEYFDLIYVIYSGYKYSADDVIKDFLAENKNKDLLLVSSDRELRKVAHSIGTESITAQEFYKLFYESKQEQIQKKNIDKTVFKTSSEDSDELDELMGGISNIDIKKEDAIITNKDRFYGDKVSKKQKKLDQKLKKL